MEVNFNIVIVSYFVNLPPFFCSLVCESFVDEGHDFV
jgi:hypothetical protein